MSTPKAVRGTRDLLPPETELWNHVEATARRVFARYNFGEIRTPIFEDTSLFARGVGEETDIVSKEMYTWEDRARAQSEKAQSLTLRPENTAGAVRAYIEHKLGETGLLQKLYYIGPQFRRERPQKGRYRQFWQIGAEVIGPSSAGSQSPLRDAEVLEMLAAFLTSWASRDGGSMINSVGSSTDRVRYIAALREAARAGRSTDVRGQPASRRDESSARARLQGSERSEDHRRAAEDRGLISMTSRRRISQLCSLLSMPAACHMTSTPVSCAVSTTTRARPSSSRMEDWARRMRCSAAGGTTGCARLLADRRLRGSASRSAKTD